MLLLGIDIETSGTDPKVDRIIEIGCVLYDWDTKMPMQMLSELIDPAMETPEWQLPQEITEITGITLSALDKYGRYEKDVLAQVNDMAQFADYAVAHFGNDFDRPFLVEAYQRTSMPMFGQGFLDTSIDVKYPDRIKTRNLRHLAAEHGFLNPFSHRAVFDVLTMLNVMSGYDIDAIIARSQEPTLFVQALVSFEEKELAKERGYHWCAPKKVWWRSWKSSDYEADKMECGFRTQLLNGAPE
jgi:DNA polymerase III subunit epsilon